MLEVIPENPETMCMKGLLLNLSEGKESEGLDLAKKVLYIYQYSHFFYFYILPILPILFSYFIV